MLQDAAKRLTFTAKQIKGPGDVDVLVVITRALLRALGRADLEARLDEENMHWPEEHVDPAWLAELVRPLGHTPFDPLIPWAFNQMRKEGQRALAGRFVRDSPDVLAWFLAKRPDLGKISLRNALEAADEYAAIEAAKVVYQFPDGWTMRRLETARELRVEGERMDHCVGGQDYCDKVADGDSIIYSLRDPAQAPHVTLEYLPDESRFRQIYGPGDRPITDAVRPYVIEFITRVHGGSIVDLQLAGVPLKDLLVGDLRGRDLRGLVLTEEDLTGVDLSGADLRNANLSYATLIGAKFIGTRLEKAQFLRANIQGANFRGAQLQGANLAHAKGAGAAFDGANLERATLDVAEFTAQTSFVKASMSYIDALSTQFDGADMREVVMIDADLSDAELRWVDLRGARAFRTVFTNAALTSANLDDAILKGARMGGIRAANATFIRATMTDALLSDAYLHKAVLRGASLDGAALEGAVLIGADFTKASLVRADLTGASLEEAILTGAIMPDGTQHP